MNNHRIKHSLYLNPWNYRDGDKNHLRQTAVRVLTNEYTEEMEGHIFCPECCVSLYRSPKQGQYDRKGRPAFYAHTKDPAPYCSLRVKQSIGKKYENEEQASKAIENEDLLIVQGFMQESPIPPDSEGSIEYRGGAVEDQEGELTEIAIGRHDGEMFKLPSRITTIRGLCRNFDKNYYRYIVLPNQNSASLLGNQIINIQTVTEPCDTPKLYFAKIINSHVPAPRPSPNNIRMTRLEFPRNYYVDFHLKTINSLAQEHGINDQTKNRIVLMYGKVTVSGIGLCIENLDWGELSLLPEKYEYLLT